MPRVIVAPFANSDLREWPLDCYGRLVCLLLERPDMTVDVVGTAMHHGRAEALARLDPSRVRNLCGGTSWEELVGMCRAADCVVGNNSGVAHLAGQAGATVVCVFGGSNDRAEWGALGPDVTLISLKVACAPCHLRRAADCRHGLACLAGIDPGAVARVVLGRVGASV